MEFLLLAIDLVWNQMEWMKSRPEDEPNTQSLWTSQIQHFLLPHQSFISIMVLERMVHIR